MSEKDEYSVTDHPHIVDGAIKEVFGSLRTEIKRLDPCVTEEFKKLYVAYKAETNFVDVVPQANRLLLTLNIAVNEIVDPKGTSKDVSGKGRWGNGDIQVSLSNKEDLPYVLGLVLQALERQMDIESY